MRLDKFLKVSRLIKRRTLAKEVCDGGAVEVNRRPAKASTEIKPGDVITLNLGNRWMTVEVLATPEHAPAERARELYRVLAEGKKAGEDHL
ncbi:MAG: RNA-binding S4 domain-containing protein [Thermoanaerobacteraceae bacterium]|uniref:RNA-binding S4 domain-containing protein n=1 Tax=Thermanaeromonas sp. C210 TaxID=2731925 RepID=UPI00155CDF45|nr:RNA-binding S4 domain-containing protein [Thermanaeromonas sp. C210]MBE3580908.1 RNA-binding S4 domain-containing protein [Thermoanaerobacteraceae bacterium]GFN21759.1 RNA-binding protein S4 [Thermanaeromonas sp. C210]